jgi:UPF0755 protein
VRFFLCTCLIFAGVFSWVFYNFSASGPLTEPVTLVFAPATHFTAIADELAEKGVIIHPLLFKMLSVARGESSKFKAGEYNFPAHISPREVADMMASGKTVMHHVTIPEGLMTSEIIEILKTNPMLEGEITLDVHEGELLPETYNFSRGDKRNELLTRMHHAMQKTVADAWASRADNLPLNTPEQAITLASIVEKETGLVTERAHVASVYINRLRKGMLLQADPTTAYAVTHGKYKLPRPLNYNDLALESPYNTYQSVGLPPGPIANPGKASILATLHPIASDDIYFVATGTGGHNFARTLQEHEANVRLFRQRAH